jgi:hypothetical protein
MANISRTIQAHNIVPASYQDTETAIRAAWGADTSADEAWDSTRPELGQCAVTALVVQDIFGGQLKRTLANGVSHYYNEVDGETVDLTRAQFNEPLIVEEPVSREREYVLSFPATAERYQTLIHRLESGKAL